MEIALRVAEIQRRIEDAAARAGRNPSDVLLVAISKGYPLNVIQAAYDAGLRHFGENRVEEAVAKIEQSRTLMPDATWHMVGHIQSRKTDEVARFFQCAHSVDRFKIARRLSESAAELGRVVDVLLEVNISGEGSKYGYRMSNWSRDHQALAALCNDLATMHELSGIRLQGLMTMAPYADDPEEARPVFRQLGALRDALCERLPQIALPHLSMGMSGDFEIAVEEGSTMVRVGTAIFGSREG